MDGCDWVGEEGYPWCYFWEQKQNDDNNNSNHRKISGSWRDPLPLCYHLFLSGSTYHEFLITTSVHSQFFHIYKNIYMCKYEKVCDFIIWKLCVSIRVYIRIYISVCIYIIRNFEYIKYGKLEIVLRHYIQWKKQMSIYLIMSSLKRVWWPSRPVTVSSGRPLTVTRRFRWREMTLSVSFCRNYKTNYFWELVQKGSEGDGDWLRLRKGTLGVTVLYGEENF